jgi:hypothetical protein
MKLRVEFPSGCDDQTDDIHYWCTSTCGWANINCTDMALNELIILSLLSQFLKVRSLPKTSQFDLCLI